LLAQPFVAAFQMVRLFEPTDSPSVELSAATSLPTAAIELLGDLALGLLIEQVINLANDFHAGFPQIPSALGQGHAQFLGGAAFEAQLRHDLPIPVQRHIFE
jgi:hypothetical protein